MDEVPAAPASIAAVISVEESVPLAALHPWEKNPRRNADAINKVAESIRQFGFAAPIVARKSDGRIIAGHTRYEAAKVLGLKGVPVRWLELNDHDAGLLTLADNRLGDIATWDPTALKEVLGFYAVNDLAVTGFQPAELADLMKEADDAAGDADKEPPAVEPGYMVLVTCADEKEQAELLGEFSSRGLRVKALTQ